MARLPRSTTGSCVCCALPDICGGPQRWPEHRTRNLVFLRHHIARSLRHGLAGFVDADRAERTAHDSMWHELRAESPTASTAPATTSA